MKWTMKKEKFDLDTLLKVLKMKENNRNNVLYMESAQVRTVCSLSDYASALNSFTLCFQKDNW